VVAQQFVNHTLIGREMGWNVHTALLSRPA
jgi:hypothetical protein